MWLILIKSHDKQMSFQKVKHIGVLIVSLNDLD
jgi:hypothetical protein